MTPPDTRYHTPSVCIIILQYNNSAEVLRCLASVKELNYPRFSVQIVDNSTKPTESDNTIKFLAVQSEQPVITYLKAPANLGYSGGNNLGLRRAREEGTDYALLLNPDVTVPPDLLAKLVAAGERDKNCGLLSPVLEEGSRRHYGGRMAWCKSELPLAPVPNVVIGYLPGTCLLIKRAVWERIGYLDENYFLYFEDVDYCARACRAGFALQLVLETSVRHQVSSTTRALGDALRLRYHFRNALYFNRRHAPFFGQILLPLWTAWIILKQLGKLLIWPARRPAARAILRGVRDFYANHMGQIHD